MIQLIQSSLLVLKNNVKLCKSFDCFGYSQVVILFDNWAVHKSMITINDLRK